MEIMELTSNSNKLSLVAIGDAHAGSLNADLDSFRGALEYAKAHRSMVLLMGDLVEALPATDRRWDPANVDRKVMTMGEQMQYLEETLEHFGGNHIIGMIMGNHYHRYAVHAMANEKMNMCKRLGCAYLGYRANIILRLNTVPYTISAWHGNGGGYEPGAVINRMVKEPRKFSADVYMMGHSHRLMSFHTAQLGMNGGDLKAKYPLFVNTGSFLRTYAEGTSGYGEQKGYDPLPIGFSEIIFENGKLPRCVDHIMECGACL